MSAIQISRYELCQKASLNRVDLSSVREGCLIRFNGGYGCIQPWPELGDLTLEECLADLEGERNSPLVRQALECCEIDAEARKSSQSLFTDLTLPESHATLPQLQRSHLLQARQDEFKAVKIKRGKDWMRQRIKLQKLMEEFSDLKWRIDFNGAFSTKREFQTFLNLVPRELIDFIEDPFNSFELMAEYQGPVLLGYDRYLPAEGVIPENGVLIAKPALLTASQIDSFVDRNAQRVVFTSYMDHPVGQAFAAVSAAQYYQSHGVKPNLCGLITHHLYEETPFSEKLGAAKPKFPELQGTGIGFDSQLNNLQWNKLR